MRKGQANDDHRHYHYEIFRRKEVLHTFEFSRDIIIMLSLDGGLLEKKVANLWS